MGTVEAQEINPAMWEALIRRGMAYSKDGIMMLNRKGRRWLEKRIGQRERDMLREQTRALAPLQPAEHWGEGKKLDVKTDEV